MTPVHFEAGTATMRLDRETFAAMVAYAAQPSGDAAHLAELREAGVYRDGRFHPALEEGLDAVLNPVCRLEVRVAGAHGREDHCDGWVTGDAAGFLLPAQGQLCEFVVVHPGFVPEQLARVVGLGPRPRAPAAERLELGPGLLDELTAADPGRRTGALRRVLDGHPGTAGRVARALTPGFRARWEVVMRWLPAPGSAGQRAVPAGPYAAHALEVQVRFRSQLSACQPSRGVQRCPTDASPSGSTGTSGRWRRARPPGTWSAGTGPWSWPGSTVCSGT